jgi:hypothetical protein
MRLLPQIFLVTALILGASASRAIEQTPASATVWPLADPAQIGGHATTIFGKPQVRTEPDGKALHFDGIADGVLVPVNPLEGLAQFTIEILFRPETGGPAEQRFLHIQDELGSRALMEIRLLEDHWALDTFLYSLKSQSQLPLLDRTKLHPANRWTWVALTYANGHMAHYIDGAKELEGDVTFPPTLAGQISLGVRQNKVFWFKGSIREVRFHPVALAPGDMQHAK